MFVINAAWIAWIVLSLNQNTMGMSALTLPASANCGNQAVLTCTSTDCNLGYRFIKDDVIIYTHRGPVGGVDADKYSGVVISNSQVQLTITNIQLSDSGEYGCNCGFEMLSAYETMQYTCMATLTVPSLANCEDQVVLTCKSTDCNTAYKFIRDGVTIYNHIGPINEADPERYSITITNDSQVQLIINKIELSDAGIYRCNCKFNEFSAAETLQYQCHASNASVAVSSDKKLQIAVDRLYPMPSYIAASLTNLSSQLSSTYKCRSSPTLAYHYKCTWESTASLPDGSHDYTITITIGTQEALLSGFFTIVTPTTPTLSNMTTFADNREILRGVQDKLLTIQCVSKGGIPAPTLAWYRDNTSTSPLSQSSTPDNVMQPDRTYTVTLTHRFTPSRTDDMMKLLCRVFYPGATHETSPDPSPASAFLYLALKPDLPTVSQTGEAVAGGYVTLRCTSTNGRPAPNITWSYNGQTFTATNNYIFDPKSGTYTVLSVLQIPASAVDNGYKAECRVSHTTLSIFLTDVISPIVLTYPPPDGHKVLVTGTVGQAATIEIKYWSNVNDSVVTCYKLVGGSRSPYSCSITTDTEITLHLSNQMVAETLATIKIPIGSETDFSEYDIIVRNSARGESVLSVSIVPPGPPSAPTIAANVSIAPGYVILTVVPGFHGGHNQTLVVQISTDLTSWTNITSVDIELDIRHINIILDNLIVNTLHHVRVFAYNIDGRSYFSKEVNFTSSYDISTDVSSNFNTVTVAGAAVGVISFLAVIGVVIFISRKYNCSVKFERKTRTSSEFKTMAESGNIYEQAVTDTDTTHVYSQIQIQLVDNFNGEERTTTTDLYERPAVSTTPEHVYTGLSTPSPEPHVSTHDRSRDKRFE